MESRALLRDWMTSCRAGCRRLLSWPSGAARISSRGCPAAPRSVPRRRATRRASRRGHRA